MRLRITALITAVATMSMLIGPVATNSAAATTHSSTTTVRVGMTPFYDYQFWAVAKQFGWDKQLGLNLQFTWFTQSGPSTEALVHGSIDTINTCVVCNYPFYQSIPNLMDFLTTDQFKGFIVVGRKGKSHPYSYYLKKLGNAQKAKVATIRQFKGKTFPEYTVNYLPLIKAVLKQGGLKLSDIHIINFADDNKAALAMLGGTGDFYVGGLPSEVELILNHRSKFVTIGGSEIMGPAGLWYSQIASTSGWLKANPTAALKIMAMNYRFNRYINQKPGKVLPIVRNAMNSHSGANLSMSEIKGVMKTFLQFNSYQVEKKTTYAKSSPLYWAKSAAYYIKNTSGLPPGADYRKNNPLEKWFSLFLKNKSLLKWIDKPL